jgi:phage pi2 protein 07
MKIDFENLDAPIIRQYGDYIILAQDESDYKNKVDKIQRGNTNGFYTTDVTYDEYFVLSEVDDRGRVHKDIYSDKEEYRTNYDLFISLTDKGYLEKSVPISNTGFLFFTTKKGEDWLKKVDRTSEIISLISENISNKLEDIKNDAINNAVNRIEHEIYKEIKNNIPYRFNILDKETRKMISNNIFKEYLNNDNISNEMSDKIKQCVR